MSKKDFQLVADAMRASKPDGYNSHPFDYEQNVTELNQWKNTCDNLADAFAAKNPRFDRQLFLTACGYTD